MSGGTSAGRRERLEKTTKEVVTYILGRKKAMYAKAEDGCASQD